MELKSCCMKVNLDRSLQTYSIRLILNRYAAVCSVQRQSSLWPTRSRHASMSVDIGHVELLLYEGGYGVH